MATGRLGNQDVAATTYTNVYTCPADTFAVVSLNLLNRGSSTITARVAITTATPPSTPANSEFIEFDVQISAKGVLERTGIVVDAGKILSVYCSSTGATAVAYGIETSTV